MVATEVRADEERLRFSRRERLVTAMEAAGVDVIVAGREANARYISGAPRLWMAGSRPFGAGCVFVRDTAAVYLLTTWDEGVPPEIPHENLYGISFNSANILAALRRVDGADTARTVATDGLTGPAAALLKKAFPLAEIVDGEGILRRARAVKTSDEVSAIRAAVGIAEQAVEPVGAALRPGTTGRRLTAVFMEAMAAAGVTTPATQDVAWVTSRSKPWGRERRDSPIEVGDLVALDAGVILDGYAGEIGRTFAVAPDGVDEELARQWSGLWHRLLDACRPGATLKRLLDAYPEEGLEPPPTPVARGLGLGLDEPLASHALPRSASAQRLEVGMVLALSAHVWREGRGAVYGQEPVLITDTGPELLSTQPFDPRSC